MPCMTEPAPRKRSALKKPCATRCAIANAYPIGLPSPAASDHVADLAHRRPGQGLLDVVLGAADDGAEEQRDRADDRDGQPRGRRVGEDRVGPDEQVDARGDHGGRVDQRRHRGRALHRVEQPGLQRHLRGLAAGAEQEQQPERGVHAAARRVRAVEDAGEVDRAERAEHEEDRDREPGVTDPVDDERLLGRDRRGRLELPEPDQQVGRQADALPADVQDQVVVGQHQQQHRGDEQVHVAEEPPPAGVVRHVADRVDVDERANAGDQQHERYRQRVEQQVASTWKPPTAIQVNMCRSRLRSAAG